MAVTESGLTDNEEIVARDVIKHKAQDAIDQINDDLVTLDGSPTNGELVAILTRVVRNQKHIIRQLSKLL
jgi:hypothetical protein